MHGWAVAIALLLSASGCSGREGPPPSQETLPPTWDSGVPLLAYQKSGTHSGAQGAHLFAGRLLDKPATCAAYRDETRHDRDGCYIRDAKYSWEQDYDWIVAADWAGCPGGGFEGCPPGTRSEPYEGRVVAYDADGYPVAWWAGAEGPDVMYVTE